MKLTNLNSLDIDALYELGLQEFNGELWYTKNFLKETFNAPGYYIGAYDGNKLVGGILVRKYDRPKLWIYFFIVDKEYRRKGIGSRLLNEIETLCTKDYFLILVDFEDKDISAKNFYLKNRFEKSAEIKSWFGEDTIGLIYSKNLSC